MKQAVPSPFVKQVVAFDHLLHLHCSVFLRLARVMDKLLLLVLGSASVVCICFVGIFGNVNVVEIVEYMYL